MQALRNPGLRDRHWDQLSASLGVDLHPDESFTLETAAQMRLLDHASLKELMRVSDIAGKEFGIEQALDKMMVEWSSSVLIVTAYRETGTFIIKVRLPVADV